MHKPSVSAHIIVKNEQNWIWYAVMSVIDYVDELLVWDTGSTDRTVDVVKSISHPKLKLREYHQTNPAEFTLLRQQMLESTGCDWILIVDGDEIWPRDACIQMQQLISANKFDYLISRFYNLVGDIYHYQPASAGRYHIGNQTGHITIRVIKRATSGLHFDLPYGAEGLFNSAGIPLQNAAGLNSAQIETPYFHATHLRRSPNDGEVMQRENKLKFELGLRFPQKFDYPAAFYLPAPLEVVSPWISRSAVYTFNALWQTPLKNIKRRILL